MTKPTKIRSEGTIYLSEAIATDKTTEKIEYMGESYYAEKLPAEYVMLEGVAYKRLMSVADYNKKAVMEGSAPIKPAKKIRIKGTDTVLEAIDRDNYNFMTGRSEPRKADEPEVAHVKSIKNQLYPIMEELEKLESTVNKGFSTRDEQIKKAYLYAKNSLYALSYALGGHIEDIGGSEF